MRTLVRRRLRRDVHDGEPPGRASAEVRAARGVVQRIDHDDLDVVGVAQLAAERVGEPVERALVAHGREDDADRRDAHRRR